jgi:hypothetical protein
MFLKRVILFSLFISISRIAFAQELHSQLEQSMELGNEEEEYLLDELSSLDLNNITEDDIESIHFLTPFQKQALWNYLQKHRPIRSLYELHYILGFSKDDAKQLASISTLKPQQYSDTVTHPFLHTLMTRIGTVEKRTDGEIDEDYYGYPRIYNHTKYSLRNNRYRAGITFDIDRGEDVIPKEGKIAPEHLSLYGQIEKGSSTLIIGDYDIRFAQGLIAWNGFGLSKGFAHTNIRKSSKPFVPHTSSDENDYCTGLAYRYQLKKLEATIVVSENKKDGSCKSVDVVSFKTSGYHSTHSDRATKNNLKHSLLGGRLKYGAKHSEYGFQIINHKISDLSQSDSSQTQFKQTFGSFDFAIKRNKAIIFGEYAMDDTKKVSTLSGLQLSPLAGVEWSLLHRYYAPKFKGYTSNAFSEYSGVNNEHGLYTAVLLNGFSKFEVTANLDYFTNPAPQFRQSFHTTGSEYSISPKYQLSEHILVWGRYAYQNKKYDQNDSLFTQIGEQERRSLYIKCNALVHKMSFTFGSAYAKSHYKNINEFGILVFFQMQLNIGEKCRMTYQTVRHNTTYNSRLYLYDPRLHNQLYVPAYIGDGYRNSIRFQLKMNHFDAIIKYAYQTYSNTYKEIPENIQKQNIDIGVLLRF